MIAQPDFPLFCIKPEHPNVEWLKNTLKEKGWMTRKQILDFVGFHRTEHNLRWVRALAEAAGADVVKGQKGFNHISNCTPEEINHSANQSIDQGKHMIRYGIKLRRRAHELIR